MIIHAICTCLQRMNTASLAMPKAEVYFSMILDKRASIIFGDWCLTTKSIWRFLRLKSKPFFGDSFAPCRWIISSEAATTRAKLDCLQGTVGWRRFYPHLGSYRLIAVSQAQRYLAAAGKPGGPFGTLGHLPFLQRSCVDFEFVMLFLRVKCIVVIYTHYMMIYIYIYTII